MKAWQRRVREEKAVTDADDNLFGAWWNDLDLDIAKATVREIDYRTAANVIEKYEWMGRMPAIVLHCYGIYFDGVIGGAVVYSPEYSENLGVWGPYGYTGRIILLSRGACVHWAHEHAGSKLVRGSIAMLPPQYEVVTATVDDAAGEIGTIYQACGFTYVGRMYEGTRQAVILDGELFTGRTVRRRFGTGEMEGVLAQRPDAEFVTQSRKGRYFAFRGPRFVRRKHAQAISHLVKSYPKRAVEAQADERRETIAEGAGSTPADRFRTS